MLKRVLAGVIAALAVTSLTACTPSNDGGSRMMQIYVTPDNERYIDTDSVMKGKDTVVVDDSSHLRVLTLTEGSCAKTVERVLTDETNIYIYFDKDDEGCASSPEEFYVEKVSNVSFGDFEKMIGYFFCTTDDDCKPVENLIFQRLV